MEFIHRRRVDLHSSGTEISQLFTRFMIIIIFSFIYIIIGLFGPIFTTRCFDTGWHGVCSLCRERHLVFCCLLLHVWFDPSSIH